MEIPVELNKEQQEKPIEKLLNPIKENDLVLLWFEDEVTYLVEVVRGKKIPIHRGRSLLADDWIGKNFGAKVVCEHGVGYLLKPSTDDLMMKASRESGVIYPKDAAFLIVKTGIGPGSKVMEIGTGSGSLTMCMANAVRPAGSIWTFDCRTDLPKNAVKNITRAGLKEYVHFCQRIPRDPFPEKDFDVVTLDIPTPWEEVENIKQVLKPGGRLVSLNPTFNQIERMAEALRRSGFILVEAIELLERPILAREGKTRPVQRMVSHTEFLVFAVLPEFS